MNNYLKNRGQVSTIAPAIITLIVAATFLVLGIIISQSITNVPNDISQTVTNESGGSITAAGYTLLGSSTCSFNSPSVLQVWNASDGVLITSGNYTLSSTGILTNATATTWASVNITYTYNWGDQACVAGNKTVVGLGTFADFWDIIVLAIIISVVIGLLLIVFGGRKER